MPESCQQEVVKSNEEFNMIKRVPGNREGTKRNRMGYLKSSSRNRSGLFRERGRSKPIDQFCPYSNSPKA